jgi:hypothetical protein
LLLLVSMWLVSGCVVTPIDAQEGIPADVGNATLAIAPVSGVPGDTVFVSGAGWASNEAVYVNLEHTPDGEQIQTTVAIATSDGEGRFTATFTYPVDPIWREPGSVNVVAYSVESGARASAAFEVLEAPAPTPVPNTPTPTPVGITTLPATVTPTPRPTTAPASNVGRVVSSALNVRSGPSTLFPVQRSIGRGTEFTVLGQNNSGAWLFVRLRDGMEGWLARAYTDFTALVQVVPSPRPPSGATPTPTRPPTIGGWRGEYFNNANLAGSPRLVRDDANLDFDWGFGSPAPSIPVDFFSARWVRSFFLPAGTYRFYALADDGVRVWVNGELIINEWSAATGRTYSAARQLDAGSVQVRVEYFEARQIAKLRVWWEAESSGNFPDWRGDYFANMELRGAPAFSRNDRVIDFDWGLGAPADNFPSDRFSVRWTRDFFFDSGNYRFRVRTDDGMRVFLNDELIIDEWRSGSVREVTRDLFIHGGTQRLRVEFFEETGSAVARFGWERIDGTDDHFDDWRGEYWDNRSLDGSPRVVRNDRRIDFNWGTGSPDSRIPDDNFSARWTQRIDFDNARYRFYARSDDGVRVWVGDNRIINEWRDMRGDETFTAELNLDGDERVKVEYYERTGGARIRVWWEKIDGSLTATPTPTATATPGAINPFLDVVPGSGGAGTTVTLTGGGFPANTTVNLYLGGVVRASDAAAAGATVRASAITDRFGNFSLNYTLPATWPDGAAIEPGRLVFLVATADFGVEATATFEYRTATPTASPKPSANVSPNSGGPGTRVTVRGGGFPVNTTVQVFLAGLAEVRAADAPRAYAEGRTDGLGNYDIAFNLPSEWATGGAVPTGKLIMLVATPDFGVEASAEFDFFVDPPNPSLEVSPSVGTAGTTVRVSGGGFPASSAVNLFLGSLDDQVGGGAQERIYASSVSDRFGNFSMAFTMPAQWPDGSTIPSGRVAIVVANVDFSIVVGGSFDYRAPAGTPAPTPTVTNTPVATPAEPPSVGASPRSGGANTQVTVSGSGFPANVTVGAYLAEFSGGGGFAGEAERYATSTTDASGAFSLSFRMPERWPNGDRIEDERVLIVVATDGFGVQASVSFAYDVAGAAGVGGEATVVPTDEPTDEPTAVPTDEPTVVPTDEPTVVPTDEPTVVPTDEPTVVPTDEPMDEPTAVPTDEPTVVPTDEPTAVPTDEPTAVPTDEPTAVPTDEPTVVPTDEPTAEPTDEPTAVPTDEPTAVPTDEPTEPVAEEQEDADTIVIEEEPTATPVPPTATPVPPTATPVPPTATPVPPTATPVPPTATPVPPTATPLPPTATPVPVEPTLTPTPTVTLVPVEEGVGEDVGEGEDAGATP